MILNISCSAKVRFLRGGFRENRNKITRLLKLTREPNPSPITGFFRFKITGMAQDPMGEFLLVFIKNAIKQFGALIFTELDALIPLSFPI